MEHICKSCGISYKRNRSVKISSFCSRPCMYSFGHSEETIKKIKLARARQVGTKHPRWKGRIKRGPYFYLKLPSHPFSGKQGYVAEHRVVMEKSIGRFLKKEETIHHINHNPEDNRIENLALCESRGSHTKMYHPEIFIANSILNKGIRRSRRTEFKRGQRPWNKK